MLDEFQERPKFSGACCSDTPTSPSAKIHLHLFYCCVTNSHTFSILKQHRNPLSQGRFRGKFKHDFLGPLCSVLQVCGLLWMLNQEKSPCRLHLTACCDLFPFQLYNLGSQLLAGCRLEVLGVTPSSSTCGLSGRAPYFMKPTRVSGFSLPARWNLRHTASSLRR